MPDIGSNSLITANALLDNAKSNTPEKHPASKSWNTFEE